MLTTESTFRNESSAFTDESSTYESSTYESSTYESSTEESSRDESSTDELSTYESSTDESSTDESSIDASSTYEPLGVANETTTTMMNITTTDSQSEGIQTSGHESEVPTPEKDCKSNMSAYHPNIVLNLNIVLKLDPNNPFINQSSPSNKPTEITTGGSTTLESTFNFAESIFQSRETTAASLESPGLDASLSGYQSTVPYSTLSLESRSGSSNAETSSFGSGSGAHESNTSGCTPGTISQDWRNLTDDDVGTLPIGVGSGCDFNYSINYNASRRPSRLVAVSSCPNKTTIEGYGSYMCRKIRYNIPVETNVTGQWVKAYELIAVGCAISDAVSTLRNVNNEYPLASMEVINASDFPY